MTISECDFKLEQKVVYPSQGLGEVTEIFEKEFEGENTYYYKIYIESSDMNVMVPVSRAKSLGIRAVVSREEAQAALDSIGEGFTPPTSDWKVRYQMNLNLLKSGTIGDIASIVACLYHRSKIKELPTLERRLYDNAKRLLEDELAEAFGSTREETEALLAQKLEPLGLHIEKKAAAAKDEEYDNLDETDESETSKESESDGDGEDED